MILSKETELDKSFDRFRQLAWQPSQVRESGHGGTPFQFMSLDGDLGHLPSFYSLTNSWLGISSSS